jgi:hypothetical protein
MLDCPGARRKSVAKNVGAVYFNHGKESGPWGSKIKALASVAKAKGFVVESLDYSGMYDPELRLQKLLASRVAEFDCLVLVGSSMGGYVATVASEVLQPQGLFLMAPALYVPGYSNQNPIPQANKIAIVHAWNDEIIPAEHSIRFARRYSAQLHLVNDNHRLVSQIPFLETIFGFFLDTIVAGSD